MLFIGFILIILAMYITIAMRSLKQLRVSQIKRHYMYSFLFHLSWIANIAIYLLFLFLPHNPRLWQILGIFIYIDLYIFGEYVDAFRSQSKRNPFVVIGLPLYILGLIIVIMHNPFDVVSFSGYWLEYSLPIISSFTYFFSFFFFVMGFFVIIFFKIKSFSQYGIFSETRIYLLQILLTIFGYAVINILWLVYFQDIYILLGLQLLLAPISVSLLLISMKFDAKSIFSQQIISIDVFYKNGDLVWHTNLSQDLLYLVFQDQSFIAKKPPEEKNVEPQGFESLLLSIYTIFRDSLEHPSYISLDFTEFFKHVYIDKEHGFLIVVTSRNKSLLSGELFLEYFSQLIAEKFQHQFKEYENLISIIDKSQFKEINLLFEKLIK